MNSRELKRHRQARDAAHITAVISTQLPDADPCRIAEQLASLELLPAHTAQLLTHLLAHPDALTSGNSSGPTGMRRLLDLLAAEHPSVQRARCHRCRAVRALPYRADGAAICGRCYNRTHRITCVRCGRTGAPAFRDDGGVVCTRCSRADRARWQTCAHCLKSAPVAYRLDGQPLCQTCGPRNRYTCAGCGRDNQIAHALTPAGPLCPRCYHRSRPQECHQCGRTTTEVRRVDAGEWICYRCWIPPTATCSSCGETKPCARGHTLGLPVCSTCRARQRAQRTCSICQRTKRIRTTLPTGPICDACYTARTPKTMCASCGVPKRIRLTLPLGAVCNECFATLRDSPARCTGCGETRPLVGKSDSGARVCGSCCGDRRNWTCRTCGRFDLLVNDTCTTCIDGARVDSVLNGPDGVVHPQLTGLRALLLSTYTSKQIQVWQNRIGWAHLVGELAATGRPITHADLDALPQLNHVHYLRYVLIDTGALPPRPNRIDAVEPWLDHFLVGQPPQIVSVLRPYASWSVLRRARHRETRGPARRSAGKYARTRITLAAQFLAWLHQHNKTLAGATQSDIDRWLSRGATTRHRLRDFLRWAHAHGLAADLTVAWLGRAGLADNILTEDERWTRLRQCLHDVTLPLDLRVAGALVLLYGQVPTHIVELTRVDLTTDATHTYLALARQPVLLPPAVADIVAELAAQQQYSTIDGRRSWLFPGSRPGTHRDPGRLGTALNATVGIHVRPARGAALCDLAADLPAPVLAELLGLSIGTATRWTALVARDWTDYLTARADTAK